MNFLLALNSEAFKHFVAGDFRGAFLEIRLGAVFLEIAVDFAELGRQHGETGFEAGFETVHVNHSRFPE